MLQVEEKIARVVLVASPHPQHRVPLLGAEGERQPKAEKWSWSNCFKRSFLGRHLLGIVGIRFRKVDP